MTACTRSRTPSFCKILAFADAQGKISTDVALARPPANPEKANMDLAVAFSDNAGAVRQAASQVGTLSTVKQALALINSDKELQSSGAKIDTALAELRKLGYAKGA